MLNIIMNTVQFLHHNQFCSIVKLFLGGLPDFSQSMRTPPFRNPLLQSNSIQKRPPFGNPLWQSLMATPFRKPL